MRRCERAGNANEEETNRDIRRSVAWRHARFIIHDDLFIGNLSDAC